MVITVTMTVGQSAPGGTVCPTWRKFRHVDTH